MPTSGVAVCPAIARGLPWMVASSCNGNSQAALLKALAFPWAQRCPMGNWKQRKTWHVCLHVVSVPLITLLLCRVPAWLCTVGLLVTEEASVWKRITQGWWALNLPRLPSLPQGLKMPREELGCFKDLQGCDNQHCQLATLATVCSRPLGAVLEVASPCPGPSWWAYLRRLIEHPMIPTKTAP